MSWSLSQAIPVDSTDPESIDLAVDRLRSIDRTNIGNQHCIPERDEQIEAALEATSELLRGAAFVHAAEVSAVLSGHANEGHQASSSGWANETISINLTITRYRDA